MIVKLLWFYFLSYGALALGFSLRRWKQHSPTIMRSSVFARLSMAVSCMTIGATLQTSHWFSPWKPVVAVGIIKFVITTCIAAFLLWIWFGSLSTLASKVILIQALMPTLFPRVIDDPFEKHLRPVR